MEHMYVIILKTEQNLDSLENEKKSNLITTVCHSKTKKQAIS